MPLQEFWNEDPDLLWIYRTSYIDRKKNEIKLQKEIINYQAWLQGFYNGKAIISAFNKGVKYLEKPLDLSDKPKTEKEKKLEVAQKIKENISRGKTLLQQRSEYKGQ